MYRLNSLSLNDCTVWKNVEFKFEEGITDIRGGNRTGKSLLFSSLPATLYGVPLPKRGLATLNFDTDESSVNITAKSNGKNNHYDIVVDGRDQKVETIADGRAVIDRLITMSDSLFYTTVHVSGLNKHPLAEAKPSQRLEWIQQVLADSQIYDGYAAIVASRMTNLKSDTGKAELLKTQIEAISKPTAPKGMDSDEYRKIIEERDEIKPVVKELSTLVDQLKLRESIGEIVEFDVERYNKLKARVEALNETKELYQAFKATQGQRDRQNKLALKIAILSADVGAPSLKPKALLAAVSKVKGKALKKLVKLKSEWDSYKDQADVRRNRKIEVKLTYKDLGKLKQDLEHAIDERRDIKRHIKLFEEGQGECPSCGKPVDKPQSTFKDIVKLDNAIENMELQEKKLWAELFEVQPKPSITIEEQETKLEKLTQLESMCESYLDFSVDEVEEVVYDSLKHKQLIAKLDGMGEARAEYRLQERMLKELPKSIRESSNVSKLLKKKQKELSELNSRLLEISDKVSEWEVYRKLLKQYKIQKERFDETLKELGDIDKKNRVLKAMKAAFSRDGLLALRLNKLVTTFVDQLNVCAPLIWNEPFKFEIDIGPRRCDVIATRNNKPGSINTFSGSEQRGWQLVSALALLRILPNNKRFDTIILDELEANMDDASQRQFVQDYLPELLKIVPKVVIITPLSRKKLDISTDRSFDVIKRKSYSTLEKVS